MSEYKKGCIFFYADLTVQPNKVQKPFDKQRLFQKARSVMNANRAFLSAQCSLHQGVFSTCDLTRTIVQEWQIELEKGYVPEIVLQTRIVYRRR